MTEPSTAPSLGFDPHALEHAFQAHRGRPIPDPRTQTPPVKLIPTSRRPRLLPTAVYLTQLGGKPQFLRMLAPGLAPAVGTVLTFPSTQRLVVTLVALAVDVGHPAQRNTTGTFYSLQCEPYTR